MSWYQSERYPTENEHDIVINWGLGQLWTYRCPMADDACVLLCSALLYSVNRSRKCSSFFQCQMHESCSYCCSATAARRCL